MAGTDITQSRTEANGLDFGYLEAGSGPLALCLHGFPDSAWGFRHLLPALAGAGFRAVAPFMRGYAPTSAAPDGVYQTGALGLDACALHEALGGDGEAVIIGHDWGAFATYAAAAWQPERWRRVVAASLPPQDVLASAFLSSYDQLRRSWYIFFFQNPLAEGLVAMDDLAFIDRLWADWSPGYDATGDLPHVKDALRAPENLTAALSYYRAVFGNSPTDPALDGVQAAGSAPPPQPTLYLHGVRDGCLGVELADEMPAHLPAEGSRVELIADAGHFLLVEQPELVNDLIVGFVTEGRA